MVQVIKKMLFLCTLISSLSASESVLFTPPEGWVTADTTLLPKTVKAMVIGKGKHEMPPTISLGFHHYDGSLKDYLKMAQGMNQADRAQWKDLGTIKTLAGNASLTQIDMQTQWGELRELQVILKKEDNVYIMTAAALKDEFPTYYNTFFTAMKSLSFKDGE